jgi:hypothetical protein
MGYGGEVSIRWTLWLATSGICWLLPMIILCWVCKGYLDNKVGGCCLMFFGKTFGFFENQKYGDKFLRFFCDL